MRKLGIIALVFFLAIAFSIQAGKNKGGKKAGKKATTSEKSSSVGGKAEVAFSGFSFENGEVVEISADKMSLLMNERKATFSKQVLVKKGGSTIYCDKLEVKYLEEGEIDWLKATGAVKVMEKDSFATGEELEYFKDKNQFVLKGNPKLMNKGQLVLGSEMIFDLGNNRLMVKEPEIQFQKEDK